MKPTHEHEFEAAPGLPEALPKGEYILWQGTPNWRVLAVEAFYVRALSIYFFAMLVLQIIYLMGEPTGFDYSAVYLSSAASLFVLGSLSLWAYLSADAAMYTITNKRVVMRIGIVLSVTYNLPLKQILAASHLHRVSEVDDISLKLKESDRIAWLHLWPHSRPWALRHPEPTLRCVDEGNACAEILKKAWTDINAQQANQVIPQQVVPTPQKEQDPKIWVALHT
jgi:Bacterial PH domain